MQVEKAVLAGLLLAVPAVLPVSQTFAQDGVRGSLTLGETLRSVTETGPGINENEGTSLVTELGFRLSSETPQDQLLFTFSTLVPLYADDNDSLNSDFFFEDPTARLLYTRESRSSLFTFSGSYRQTDVGTSSFFDETSDQDVVTGGGRRTLASVRSGITLGRDAPITFDGSYRFLDSSYEDAAPSLLDSQTQSIDTELSFRLSPVASAFVFADWEEENEDGGSDRTTTSVGVGARYSISARTDVSASLFLDNDEIINSDNDRDEDGLGARFSVNHAVPNGSWRVGMSSRQTIDGTRNGLSLGRQMLILPGSLDFSLGVSRTGDEDIEPLANVTLNMALTDTSNLVASLRQSVDSDNDGNNTVRTRLNMSYSYDINSLSSLSGNFLLASDNRPSVTGGDETTYQIGLRYRHDLGQDWDLISGISFENEQNESSADRITRTIFVGVERTFDF